MLSETHALMAISGLVPLVMHCYPIDLEHKFKCFSGFVILLVIALIATMSANPK